MKHQSEKYLDHEVFDVSMEDGLVVVPWLCQCNEVFTSSWSQIAMKLNIEISQISMQSEVAFLFGIPLYSH